MVLGTNHIPFGRPCFPLGSSCPRGYCLPVLLPVGSLGISIHSCCGVWARSVLHLLALPVSLRQSLSFRLWVPPVPSLLLARSLPSVFLQLWIMGHGVFPHSVFSLGWMRVSAFPQFSVVGISQFEATSLDVVFRAVDSALVLLSSHLNLSSPSFSLWRAGLPASSPLDSGGFVELASYLEGAFCPSLVGFWPLKFSGQLAFLSTFGAHTWGVSFWVSCLGWVLPLPLVSCVAGSALLVFALCTHCALFNGCHQVFRSLCWRFSEFACSPWTGCFTLSFFLRPLLFRFLLVQSPWLCCAFVVVPAGVFFAPVAFLPWPALLSLGPRRS